MHHFVYLEAVDRSEVALLTLGESHEVQVRAGPVVIPEVDAARAELLSVGLTADAPEELLGDTFPEHLLRRQQRQFA